MLRFVAIRVGRAAPDHRAGGDASPSWCCGCPATPRCSSCRPMRPPKRSPRSATPRASTCRSGSNTCDYFGAIAQRRHRPVHARRAPGAEPGGGADPGDAGADRAGAACSRSASASPPASSPRCTATAGSTARSWRWRRRASPCRASCWGWCWCWCSRCSWAGCPSGGQESWSSTVLPVITLGIGGAAILARFTRSAMLEVLGQPYIRAASAKGVPWRAVVSAPRAAERRDPHGDHRRLHGRQPASPAPWWWKACSAGPASAGCWWSPSPTGTSRWCRRILLLVAATMVCVQPGGGPAVRRARPPAARGGQAMSIAVSVPMTRARRRLPVAVALAALWLVGMLLVALLRRHAAALQHHRTRPAQPAGAAAWLRRRLDAPAGHRRAGAGRAVAADRLGPRLAADRVRRHRDRRRAGHHARLPRRAFPRAGSSRRC